MFPHAESLTRNPLSRTLKAEKNYANPMKNPFRNVPKTLIDSLRSPAFYRGVARKGRFAPALGHFAIVAFVLSLVVGAVPVIKSSLFLADANRMESFRTGALATYPDELELRIRDGIASSNVEEPYAIPWPGGWDGEENGGHYGPVVLIDTRKSVSMEDFREHRAVIVVGRTEVGFMEEDGGVQMRSFEEFREAGEIVINEEGLRDLLDGTMRVAVPILRVLVLFIPFFIFASLVSGYLVYLLFGALLVMVVANIRGESYGYAQAYRASLYLITVPMTYGALTSLWLFPQYRSPFVVSFLLVVMAAGLVRKAPETTDAEREPDGGDAK